MKAMATEAAVEQVTSQEWDGWVDLYDLEHDAWTSHDLPFYLEEARAAQPVLELACGTGRLTIPLARAGIPITGLDISPGMLERAQAKAPDLPNLRFVQGAMDEFTLDTAFGLIFICYSGFFALKSVEAQESTLRTVRRHLRPGGRLIMDMFVPGENELGLPTTSVVEPPMRLVNRLQHPATGYVSLIQEAAHHTPNEQVFEVTRVIQTFDPEGRLRGTQQQYVTGRYAHRYELYHLLRFCGFDIVALYSGFDRQPFGPDSSRMVWIATPSAAEVS